MTPALPRTLHLPSGRKVALETKRDATAKTTGIGEPTMLFDEVLALFDEGIVTIDADVRKLAVPDFHVLRAILARSDLVEELPAPFTCSNCHAKIVAAPCKHLEVGPYLDGELDDPELDALPRDGEAQSIPEFSLGSNRYTSVTFADRTVAETIPLWEALAAPHFEPTAAVVHALGLVAIGGETDVLRGDEALAEALAECDEDAFAILTDAYMITRYPLRLVGTLFCPECKARTLIDAPRDREFVPAFPAEGERSDPRLTRLPSFDAFAERAHAIAEPLLAEAPGPPIELVIERGAAALDEGGDALLGSYDPPLLDPSTDTPTVDVSGRSDAARITIYYRTFVAIEEDDGAYEWEEELAETIEHELEHHVYFLRGDDPMEAAERETIESERAQVVGRRELGRRRAIDRVSSFREYFVRGWLFVLLAALAFAIVMAEHCVTSKPPP